MPQSGKGGRGEGRGLPGFNSPARRKVVKLNIGPLQLQSLFRQRIDSRFFAPMRFNSYNHPALNSYTTERVPDS